MLKSLRTEFRTAIAAGESAIRINSDEIEDALTTLTEVCKDEFKKDGETPKDMKDRLDWPLRVWDHAAGTLWCHTPTGLPPAVLPPAAAPTPTGPAGLIGGGQGAPPTSIGDVLSQFLREPPIPDPRSPGSVLAQILVIKNFHLAFSEGRGKTVATIQHLVSDKIGSHPEYSRMREALSTRGIEPDADTGKFIVGIMPQEGTLPPEIAPLFKVITHELPDAVELGIIYDGTVKANGITVTDELKKKACHHALGLTRMQAEGIFMAAMIEFGDKKDFGERLVHYTWTQKSDILNAEGLVTLYQGSETFDDVVGHDGLKRLLKGLLTPDPDEPDNAELRAKGVALVGPPRTGKSATVKALGNETDRPLLFIDVGSWFGSHIGDTEKSTRKGFQIIRAHAPCIAFIDEVEKAMPSARGYEGDGGVGRRMAATFMTNLQDIKEDVFWAFAANDTESLHEAFLADDRVDCVVFVGMPDAAMRAAGWKLYLKKYFPAEVDGRDYSRAVNVSFREVLAYWQENAGKKKGKAMPIKAWAELFIPAIMCLSERGRAEAMNILQQHDGDLYLEVGQQTIDDTSWTVARIKSVCRLSRRLQISLHQASKMMPRHQHKLEKVINRLQRWASEEAIDAQTGEAYVLPENTPEAEATGVRAAGSKRRKVRTLRD